AVNAGATAVPDELVPTVAVDVPVDANVPVAPPEGAVNVTLTPAAFDVTGQPLLLCTTTARSVANRVAVLVVWGVPALTTIWSGAFGLGHDAAAIGGMPTVPPMMTV